jgi:hypothetical protein
MEVSGIVHSDTLLVLIIAPQQFLRELDSPPPPPKPTPPANRRASHTRTNSSPNLLRTVLLSERQSLLPRRRSFDNQTDNGDAQKRAPVAGGTILGIHNLAIVFPQFIVRRFPVSQRYLFLIVSVRPLLRRVRSSGSQMLKLTLIRPTLTRITVKTASLGFFALADFALWYVHHRLRLVLVCTNIAWVVWCGSLPHGPSNSHGERNETSVGRNEGT